MHSSCALANACVSHTHTHKLLYYSVAILTRPAGLAYYAINIYFSSWLALISCVYTLDQWSSSKDIISIQELTSLSATLKSWYTLFLTSLVCFGSAISLHIYFFRRAQQHSGETAFAVALGLFSTLVSLFFILVHYKFFTECCSTVKQGGWLELATACFMILAWTVGYVQCCHAACWTVCVVAKCNAFTHAHHSLYT